MKPRLVIALAVLALFPIARWASAQFTPPAGGGGGSGNGILYSGSAKPSSALTCNGSAQVLDTYTIIGGTLSVGDRIDIAAWVTKGGTTSTSLYQTNIGNGQVPLCCLANGATDTGDSIVTTWQVTGASAIAMVDGHLGLASNTDGNYGATLVTNATSAISGSITVSITQNCTSPDTGQLLAWSIRRSH